VKLSFIAGIPVDAELRYVLEAISKYQGENVVFTSYLDPLMVSSGHIKWLPLFCARVSLLFG
jgi:hypothetical protein